MMAKAKLKLSKLRKNKKFHLQRIAKKRWQTINVKTDVCDNGSVSVLCSADQDIVFEESSPEESSVNTMNILINSFTDDENEPGTSGKDEKFENCDSELFDEDIDYNNCDIELPSNDEENENSDYELFCEADNNKKNMFEITGRRLINISYFLDQLKAVKHEGFGCSFFDLVLLSEKREGLCSILTFRCNVCNKIETINTDTDSKNVNTNLAAVSGALATGIGCSQLQELFASLDVPSMSNKTYQKYHEKLSPTISKDLEELMIDAGKEEFKMAIECGDVNSEGTPLISVIVDGAWSKRSYRTNYNALSGVACIIGAKSKKILYIGVKNKYCYICSRSKNPGDHLCYKNWKNKSTSMESAIISEGFQNSLEMHNLIYARVVGDGDSSVYRKLIEVSPYGPTFVIEKVECRNHLLRNYLNKLSDLLKDSKFPIELRKKVTSSDTLRRFRNAVTKAVEFRKQETLPIHMKADLLRKDILNGPLHIFGNHNLCDAYFCSKKSETKEDLLPKLKNCGLFDAIKTLNMRLANNSTSLIHDTTTNVAETFNSIVAKFVGGKRLNFSLKGSYEVRCKAAAISFNTNGDFLCRIQKYFCDGNVGIQLEKMVAEKKKRTTLSRLKRLPKKSSFAIVDEDYGTEETFLKPDMSEELYSRECTLFLTQLKNADKEKIFDATLLQSKSESWKIERKKRLTASSFGKICKLRKTTCTSKTVSSLLYSTFPGTKSTQFGLEIEEKAIELFQKEFGKSVQRSGLIIDKVIPYLACSPDGLVDKDALLEIKSSDKSGELSPVDAVLEGIIDYCLYDQNKIALKRNHNYYYQVQGLLHISEREYCYFLIYTRKGIHVEKIKRDDQFWKINMENRLIEFYTKSLLPEIIDPRRCRQQNIRSIYLE